MDSGRTPLELARPRTSRAAVVITELAPIIAFFPILTGATNDVFDPIKAPSSIIVLLFLTPS